MGNILDTKCSCCSASRQGHEYIVEPCFVKVILEINVEVNFWIRHFMHNIVKNNEKLFRFEAI
jgi:hypothetical protein